MDPVLYWNDVALEANKVSHTNGAEEQIGPTRSSRALAIVHLAMYDAYVASAPGTPLNFYNTDLKKMAFTPQASPKAAIAAAAHATLSALFPSQASFFDKKYYEADVSPTIQSTEGHKIGLKVAELLFEKRKNDLATDAKVYVPSLDRLRHRPDPDNPEQGYLGAFYGDTDAFVVDKCDAMFSLADPPTGTTYNTAVKEVRHKGIAPELTGTLMASGAVAPRTADETLIGIFWAYDGAAGLGTPPRLYNQIVRLVAEEQGKRLSDDQHLEQNVELFARVNAAMGDAGILAWREKYEHNFWRPVLGIREHDNSTGPLAEPSNTLVPECDPFWLPLGAPATNALDEKDSKTQPTYPFVREVRSDPKNFTPNFPAYPSGHATFGAAALHTVRLFFLKDEAKQYKEDKLFNAVDEDGKPTETKIGFVSDELNGVNKDNRGTIRPRHVRSFEEGLWGMIKENAYSRVYLGVHWAFDSYKAEGVADDKIPEGIPEINTNEKIGGVWLGLKIAEAIHKGGLKAPPKQMSSKAGAGKPAAGQRQSGPMRRSK